MKATKLTFSEYRQNAPHESDRWATSDRGWAWSPENENTCFAHYLDYQGTSSSGVDGKRIHVVICGQHGGSRVVWVRRCADARIAIKAAYRRARRNGSLASR